MGNHNVHQGDLDERDVTRRLRDLSHEAARLASDLSKAAQRPVPQLTAAKTVTRTPAETVRLLTALNRARVRHFPEPLFAIPAWDMLLDLLAARLQGKQVAVSSLCAIVNVPNTTALRWVNGLVEAGLVERVPDPRDRRRILLEVTPAGMKRADVYLQQVQGLFP